MTMSGRPRHLRRRPLLPPGPARPLGIPGERGPAAGLRGRRVSPGPPTAQQSGGAREAAGSTGGHSPGGSEVPAVRLCRPGEGAAGGPSLLALLSPLCSLAASWARLGGLRGAAAVAGRCGPGRGDGSSRAGSGGRRRHRRCCTVRAPGSSRPHQGRAEPRGPRRERSRSPRRLVAILVLLLLGAACPLPARLPALPPPSAPPPLPPTAPGWLRSLLRPVEAA